MSTPIMEVEILHVSTMRRYIFNMRILGVLLFLTATVVIIAAAIYPGGVKEASAQGQSQVWCYEIVQHSDGTLSITGHQPAAVKNFPIATGDKLKARCFASWADAASFLGGGKVKLPKNASEKDYEAATETLLMSRQITRAYSDLSFEP